MLAKVMRFFIVFLCVSLAYASLGKIFKKCKIGDDTCLVVTANEIFKKYAKGDEKLGIPSIDPLKIEKMDIVQHGNASVQLNLRFRKSDLTGISDAKVYQLTGFQDNPDKNILEMGFKAPLGTLAGEYDIEGKMMILPIKGHGNFTLNLENLDVKLRFMTKKVERDGKIFMNLEKSKFRYEVTRATVNFANLFDGQKDLGDNMNLFLNANWKAFLDGLEKPIHASFGKVFKDAFNFFLDKTPYEELFQK